MGKPVLRLGVDPTLGSFKEHVYAPVVAIKSSTDVFANGIGVVRHGDKYDKHSKVYHGGTLVGTSSKVFVNGKPIARNGDLLSCGDKTTAGSSNVFAG